MGFQVRGFGWVEMGRNRRLGIVGDCRNKWG